jgi:hypothetical protein
MIGPHGGLWFEGKYWYSSPIAGSSTPNSQFPPPNSSSPPTFARRKFTHMDLKNASLKKLTVHYVGSKNNLDPLHLSKDTLDLDDQMLEALQDSFLSRFKANHENYSFHHPSSLQYNEVYNYAKDIFSGGDFVENSVAVARHLYESSTHPKVKGGELYVAYFDGLPVESRMCKAVGLFKTENKSLFLDVQQHQEGLTLDMKEGVELTKIDKGCLIIHNKEVDGYDVLIFDNQNRGEEAQYWKEKFLSLTPQKNEFHHTNHILTLAKQFITGPLEEENELEKTEKVELLHRSLDYFRTRDSFDIEEFQKEVFQEDEMIESFRQFGSRYVENNDYDIAASFNISADAVKKQTRVYKSVLKLDKNFHIYIHGRTDLIERGTEADGRKYYKIYFQEEA